MKIPTLPKWLIQTIVGAMLTASGSWVTWATATNWRHETRISVVEEHEKGIDGKLDDLKRGQDEQGQDIKELLKRTPRRH